MSRVGKKLIDLPEGIDVSIVHNGITIKGSKGELNANFPNTVKLEKEKDKVRVVPLNESKSAKASWGMARTIINNMVTGVSKGFSKVLEINGVGYRASIEENILTLQLGYSHDIKLAIPKDLEVKCSKPTEIIVSGIDKQKVGQFASEIRKLRKPEPYKGKGIKYQEELIRRKEGKKK
ncbi:MAG: 50S ribosomal protein L6 [Pelagibacterales bacterium]|nr:50S ribosomal protein L6 [Pelagibacterales bacterium]